MPWYRTERMQELMGVPLPASTQFERSEEVAKAALPVYLELRRQAACGEVVCYDDTWVKILGCLQENKHWPEKERKGLHTTAIGASRERQRIALYLNGRRHAGENVAELMKLRPQQLGPPITMAGAEAKNWSVEFQRVVAKCLQHGQRRFREVQAEFPVEAGRVLEDFAAVYRNEAQTRTMNPAERLQYHQQHSAPVMAGMRENLERLLAGREVEPNSGLGQAIRYMLNHWQGLTRFLEVEGTPLDNNLAERLLKPAVLLRKNALFYKTEHGAAVGDILMSLIHTCALNQVNPFEYLVALIRNASRARAKPDDWLPWNYREGRVRAA